MRLPQELIDGIIDRLSDDRQMLKTCSLVATTWLPRSRLHLFNKISLNNERAGRWCSAIRPGPDGVARLVRTLALQQAPTHLWLGTKYLDAISDHFSSFRHVENLSVTWLDLSDFKPGSLARHFTHFGSSLRSLHLSYVSANYSTLITFLQLFPCLGELFIHSPDLCDDNPPPRVSRTAPLFRGFLNIEFFNSTSSSFVSHLACLDLRFSSISAFNCHFSSGFPLTNLLEASSLSLRSLELGTITFSKSTSLSLMRCENLQDVTVGTFEEDRPPLLLFSLLSTLSSYHLTHLTIDFAAMPSPHWSEWKAVDAHLLQMAERCGLRKGPQVVLRTTRGMPGDAVDGRQLLPKYWNVGPVEWTLNIRSQPGN